MSRLVSEDLSEVSSDDQYPRARKMCSAFRWRQNWKCVLLTCIVSSCLIITAVYHRQRSVSNQMLEGVGVAGGGGSGKNAYWMLMFCGVISYSLYLMECSYATDRIELCNRNTQIVQRVCEKIEQMKNAQPIIWWKATCYHYARRKIRTTRFRRGTYFVSTKVYQERVNSFASSSTFNYASCGVKDISNNLVIGENCAAVVKFRFSKGFAFLNMASAIEFENQRSTFFRELRRYDDYMDIHEGLDLADCAAFDEEILALNAPPNTKPWFADPFYYWLCSCFLLSWPFRLVLAYNTVYVHYKITKLFGTNYAHFTDSIQQLALFQFYETRIDDLNGGVGGGGGAGTDSAVNTPVWSDVVTPSDDADGRFYRAAGSELVPTYSEALLLLDDYETTTCATGATDAATVAATATNCATTDAIYVNAPTTISAVTADAAAVTCAITARQTDVGDGHNDGVDDNNDVAAAAENDAFIATFSAENPPSYEEALSFPVVNPMNTAAAVAALSTSTSASASTSPLMSRFDVDVGATPFHRPRTHAQCDTRLPNSRTFLSIETSL